MKKMIKLLTTMVKVLYKVDIICNLKRETMICLILDYLLLKFMKSQFININKFLS